MQVGVDIGTSVIKAAAFAAESVRHPLVASKRTRIVSPREGWFEQDMDEVVAAVADVVRQVVEAAGRTPDLIALTGQGDGVWPVDAEGRAVRPAVSWMDARAASIVEEWIDDGVVDRVFRRNGGAVFPGCPAPVLRWLEREEPDVLDRAATSAYCKDMVMQRLTGVSATDASDASLPFLDPIERSYASDLLDLCGLAHRRDLLAPIVEPVPTGRVTAEAAALLGVPEGTPVSAGPFDLPACALGSGVVAPGEGHLVVGTTLVCQVVVTAPDTSGEPAGLTIAYGPGRWLRAMPAMVGTAALDWVLGIVGETYARVDALLAESPPGARGVTCLPFFSPSGERAPFVEPHARARFSGLTVQTTKADLVRATCEAIGYAARHCFEAAGLRGEVAICGGGARSAAWSRLFADVLGRPVRHAPTPEVGAYGAVLAGRAAWRGASLWDGPAGVTATSGHVGSEERGERGEPERSGDPSGGAREFAGETVQPNDDLADQYTRGYAKYRKLVDDARREWKERFA